MMRIKSALMIWITAAALLGCGVQSEPALSDEAGSSPTASQSPSAGETLENLRRLKIGMSEDDVWPILGQPRRVQDIGGKSFHYLEQGSIVVVENGKLFNAMLHTGQSLDKPESLK